MRDQATNPTTSRSPSPATDHGTQPAATTAAEQITVSSSLLDAAMAVDEARDDGGLGLQEALFRMHEELAPFVEGHSVTAGDADAD